MKKDIANKVKLGIFISAGVVAFLIGMFFIGQRQHLFSRTIDITFMCDNVSGLQAGNNVRFSGITVGTVKSVELVTDTTVRVHLVVDRSEKKFIKKDAQASVGSDGLMGDKVVNISAGTPAQKQIEDGDVILCINGNNMDQIMASVKVAASNAAQITTDFAVIVGNIRNGRGSIGKLFMDTVFADNLDKTIVNIKEGAGGFKQNMDAAANSFLLKGYFKKKEKEKENLKKEAEKKAEEKKEEKEEKKETEKK